MPGDALVLEEGDIVAGDAHLLEAHALSTMEASLTGESTPVEKTTDPLEANAPLAERHDSVFLGTSVATGTVVAEVTATGMRTDVLGRPPRRPDEEILARREWGNIVLTGSLQAVVTLSAFYWALQDRNVLEARNLAFSILVFGEVLRSFASRSPTKLFWEVGAFSNIRLVAVVAASVLVQLVIHHLPLTMSLFDIGELSLRDCALSLATGFIPVSALEISKLIRRARRERKA